METYYTKREFNEMKSALTKKCRALETKVNNLSIKLKELKKQYKMLSDSKAEES